MMNAIPRAVRLLLRDRRHSGNAAAADEIARHGRGAGIATAPGEGTSVLALPGVIFALMVARWAMGLPALCHIPYWYLSYTEGFIRRGFVGTFTMPLLVNRPLSEALIMIAGFGAAASLAIIAIITFRVGRRGEFDPLLMVFILSGALPWLARDLGTLDGFLVLASLGAFLLVERGSAAGLVMCVIAPLIHEGALFLLSPLLGGLFVLRPERRIAALAGATALGVTALALWLFSTTDFVWPAGMPTGVDNSFVKWELGQSFHLFTPRMTAGIVVFSILPCLAMAAMAGRRAGWLVGLGVLAGVLLTRSVVPIAIDTDRLFAWGPFTALVLAELVQRTTRSDRRSESAT